MARLSSVLAMLAAATGTAMAGAGEAPGETRTLRGVELCATSVPGAWEGNGAPGDHDGVAWYRLRFEVPDDFADEPLTLHLPPIDDVDLVFFGRRVIGATLAGAAGALVAPALGHIDPAMAFWTTSGEFVFIAILVPGPIAGITSRGLAAFGVGVISASVAGMLYHLYLGRFDNVWKARGVFTVVFLITSALFGFVFVSLI